MDTRPSCPRCGYDQSGAIAAWERIEPPSCPLSSLCTECGLEFLWRDLLNPTYARLPQLFEHARQRRITAFLVTWRRAASPRGFWDWVGLQHDVVMTRIGLFIAIAMPLIAAASVAVMVGLHAIVWSSLLPSIAWQYVNRSHILGPIYPLGDGYLLLSGWSLTLRQVCLPLELLGVLIFLFAPLTLLLLPQTLRRARIRPVHIFRAFAYSLLGVPMRLVLARIVALCLHGAAGLFDALGSHSLWPEAMAESVYLCRDWIVLGVLIAWTTTWWWSACEGYFKLPSSKRIVAVMMVVAILLSIAVMTFAVGDWAIKEIGSDIPTRGSTKRPYGW